MSENVMTILYLLHHIYPRYTYFSGENTYSFLILAKKRYILNYVITRIRK